MPSSHSAGAYDPLNSVSPPAFARPLTEASGWHPPMDGATAIASSRYDFTVNPPLIE